MYHLVYPGLPYKCEWTHCNTLQLRYECHLICAMYMARGAKEIQWTITFIYECTWPLAMYHLVYPGLPYKCEATLGCLINASGHTATHCNSHMNVVLLAPCSWLVAYVHSYMNVIVLAMYIHI